MTAITGLRRLPVGERADANGIAPDRRDLSWDRPTVELDPATVGPEPAEALAPGRAGTEERSSETAGPHRFRPSRVLPVVAAVLVGALAVGLVNRGGDGGPGPGEAEVTVDGRAQVTRSDGRTEVVTDRVRLEPGDRLDLERGTATFQLADEVRLEGAAGTSVVMDRTPTLRAGELLVDAPVVTTIEAGPSTVAVAAGGAARIARTYAVEVDAYRGAAVLASAGVERTVGALRTSEVAAAGEVGAPRPLTYEADDAWDRRYLAAALALDRQLGPLAASMRATDLDPAALLRQVRTEVAEVPTASRLDALVGDRRVRLDTSIGAAVVGNGTGSTFTERWRTGMAFHDDGAAWGLVAMALDAAPDDVTASLRRALDQDTAVLDPSPGADGTAAGGASSGPTPNGAADPAATVGGSDVEGSPEGEGTDPGSSGSGSGGGNLPTVTVPAVTVPGGNGPTVTVPTVTVPGVTVPPALPIVTQPLGTTVTTIVDTVGGVVGGVVGVLPPVLAPIVGSGGVLPILPGLGGGGSSGSGGGLFGG